MRPTSMPADAPGSVSPILAQDIRLPPEVQRDLMAIAHRRTIAHDQALFQRGASAEALFGVIEGSLRVSVLTAGGGEAMVTMLEQGHWFGEISLFIDQARVNDVRAVGTAEVAVIPARDFHQLIAQRPDIHMAFTRLLCMRQRLLMAWIDYAILHPMSMRLAARILAIDGRVIDAETGVRVLHVSQEDLALTMGVSRQSVNRQLKQWELEGIVRLRYRRIELLDQRRLEQRATAMV